VSRKSIKTAVASI